MNAPSVDIKDFLVAGGLSLTFGTNLFVGKEPESPDSCVTIFDTPGAPPDRYFNQSQKYDRPSIQIRVRDNDYRNGWALTNSIKNLLHSYPPSVQSGTTYTAIFCSQEPALLDWDGNDRARFVVSFDIQRY
jgi:hypothetical protein